MESAGPAAGGLSELPSQVDRVRQAREAVKLQRENENRERARDRWTRAAHMARLDYIVEEMLAERWTKEKARVAMLRFNVSSGTILNDAGEASRIIERSLTKDPELRSKMDVWLTQAMDTLKEVERTGNNHERVKAVGEQTKMVQVWAQIRGIDAPKRVAVGSLSELLALGMKEAGQLETTGEETEGSSSETPIDDEPERKEE